MSSDILFNTVLAASLLSQFYCRVILHVNGHDLIDLQRFWSTCLCGSLWSGGAYLMASRLPRVMAIPIAGTLIRVDLFCAIWISCVPIGLALGGAVLDHLMHPYSLAAIHAIFVLNILGLLAGPVFAGVVVLTLRTRRQAEPPVRRILIECRNSLPSLRS